MSNLNGFSLAPRGGLCVEPHCRDTWSQFWIWQCPILYSFARRAPFQRRSIITTWSLVFKRKLEFPKAEKFPCRLAPKSFIQRRNHQRNIFLHLKIMLLLGDGLRSL